MSFELLPKGLYHGRHIMTNEVSVRKTCISFGKEIIELFKETRYVNVYVDKETNEIAFEPTNNEITGYKASMKTSMNSKGKVERRIGNSHLCKIIPIGIYIATIKDGLAIIKVEELLK